MTGPIGAPPALGAAIRHEWQLDPGWLTVNHGSFGATPRIVLAAQDEWRRRIEAQPSRFMRRMPARRLARRPPRGSANSSAPSGRDIAFVDNATVGCNAVLRSLRFAPGDEILVLDHGYRAVRNTARYVAERSRARIVEASMPFPDPDAASIVACVERALSKRTRLVILDHITSPSALVLPLARLVALCHAAGAPVLVDGAHGPGQIALDLTAIAARLVCRQLPQMADGAEGLRLSLGAAGPPGRAPSASPSRTGSARGFSPSSTGRARATPAPISRSKTPSTFMRGSAAPRCARATPASPMRRPRSSPRGSAASVAPAPKCPPRWGWCGSS